MTDWYPRARVVLFIRFEEYGSKPSTPVPGKKQLARKGTGGGELKVTVDPESPPGKTRYLLTSEKSGGKESSPDGLSQPVAGIAPKNAKLQLNGLKQASTLDLEFSYLDAPFDPRCIRSCAIEYYFGTLTEDECARAAGNVVFLPDDFVDVNGVLRSNRRFTGWVDSWEVDVKDGNPATIHLQCRDSRQVLIDQQSPPQLKVATKTPLDKAIANYLSEFPQFDGLAVEYRGDGEAPTLDGVMQGPHKQGQGPAKGDKSSVWDYLVDMAGMVGCILFMQEQTVVIAKPRTVLGSGNVREDDPYNNSPRELRGMQLPYRTFIYGENIKDMRFGRKFNAAAPTNIEVRCFVPGTLVQAVEIERAYRREYSGPITSVTIRGFGTQLTGTPNHPVLTTRGWVALGCLVNGDELICCPAGEGSSFGNPNVDTVPTKIEDLFVALENAGDSEWVPTRNVDFHGDGMDSDVHVVLSNSLLRNGVESPLSQHQDEFVFKPTSHRQAVLECNSPGKLGFFNLCAREWFAPGSFMGCPDEGFDGCGVSPVKTEAFCLLVGSNGNPHLQESCLEPSAILPGFEMQLPDGHPINVTLRTVLNVRTDWYSGHVYNLQTPTGWYVAGGVIAHNCYLGSSKKTLVVRFPDVQTTANPGNAGDKKWMVWRMAGISDPAMLKIAAQSIYEQGARKELSVKITTHELSSYGGDVLEPDALDLQPGDPIEVYVNAAQQSLSELEKIEDTQLAEQRLIDFLVGLGHNEKLARVYARVYVDNGFQTTFRTRTVRLDYAADSGVSMEIEAVNFVEVRYDKES